MPFDKAPCRADVDFAEVMWLSCNKLRPAAKCLIIKRNAHLSTGDTDQEGERGTAFTPKFGTDGLLTAVVTDVADGAVLMVAHMDAEALRTTRETGLAHFHSRSRGRLWMKGETSGNSLRVERILVDCDQDALVLEVVPAGPACHTGARSCFYRVLESGALVRVKT